MAKENLEEERQQPLPLDKLTPALLVDLFSMLDEGMPLPSRQLSIFRHFILHVMHTY